MGRKRERGKKRTSEDEEEEKRRERGRIRRETESGGPSPRIVGSRDFIALLYCLRDTHSLFLSLFLALSLFPFRVPRSFSLLPRLAAFVPLSLTSVTSLASGRASDFYEACGSSLRDVSRDATPFAVPENCYLEDRGTVPESLSLAIGRNGK